MNLSIDCDGVLVDYQKGYIDNWKKHFGYEPKLINPNGLMFHEKFDIPKLEGEELKKFQATFDEEFWENLEPLPYAAEACALLNAQGFKLYCNTAIKPRFKEARAKNLEKHGMVFQDILATPTTASYNRLVDVSPKINACKFVNAKVHVDDYGPFFRGFPKDIRKIIIGTNTIGFEPEPFDAMMPDLFQSALHIIAMRAINVIK